jgi:Zn-dependent M28 family amino/carboxypeptidase
MSETQKTPSFLSRRPLIILIIVLIIIQARALAYLWTTLRPPKTQAEPTVGPTTQQYQLPTQPLTSETPQAIQASGPGSTEIELVAGPPIAATNYTRYAAMFDEEQAMEHIAYLASDELAGRAPGTPGGRTAGDYVAARFAEYGLQPAGNDGTYFQTFAVPYGQITELPAFTITPPRGETLTRTYAYRADYRALTGGYIGAGEGAGQVIWLNECQHDDYAAPGLDVVGKIVMCRYTYDSYIYRQAIEHQVGGLLLLDREGNILTNRRPPHREIAWVPQTIPTYLITEDVARDLLVGTDYTLDDLSLRFTATPLSTTVNMAVVFEEQAEVEARNVLGFLPGADPNRSAEIVVIGAHYDHLGREPDGEIMNGANDNASGVATVLEIARLWQEQGYTPARSVLFAAWDGEEIALSGARYYVEHPTRSLTRTVAMLNLDMVGAGETLHIDGEGLVAAQLQASADVFGVTTTLTFDGGSDHMAFYEAGIPAAMPIWLPDAVYHTPADKMDHIDPPTLKASGSLSAHTLAALAEGHVELEQAVARLCASIVSGDKEAFLAGIDAYDPALRASQAAWFDNVWSRDLLQAIIEPGQIRIGDGEADVNLTTAYRWADAVRAAPSVSYDVRFVQRNDAWYLAGYKLNELAGDIVTVASFPDVTAGITELLTVTQAAYVSLAADLGVEPAPGARFIYYPDAAVMQSIARPATANPPPWLVSSAGLVEIAWGQPVTPALVALTLGQMGLPSDANGADWLREGLIAHYQGDGDTTYLPTLAASDMVTSLLDFPDLSEMQDPAAKTLRGHAWSAAAYLLDRYGADGLRALCAAWGRSGDQDTAFREALGLSLDQFESAWRVERIDALRAVAEVIQTTIDARIQAVIAGDAAGFLDTVNPANLTLLAEERNWFADLADHPIDSYGAAGAIIGWSPDGAEALAKVAVNAALAGQRGNQIIYDARFVRQGERWLYDGIAWDEAASAHFVLKYDGNAHDESWAQRILNLSEEAYARITADLDALPPSPQEIEVYDDETIFRTLIHFSLGDWADGWTAPGEAIRLPFGDGDEHTIQRIVAHELTQQILFAQGLEVDWLRVGVAAFEASRVFPLGTHWTAGRYMPIVQEAVRRHDEFPLYDLPSWADVPDDQTELFHAQSWSLVASIAERYGLSGLRQLIAQAIPTNGMSDAAASLRAVLGLDTGAFEEEWRARAYVAAVPDELVPLAQAFDAERALADIVTLSSPEYGGRGAGAPGADMAAAYIAEQFAVLGLQPLGDPLTATGTATPTQVLADATTTAIAKTPAATHALEHLPRSYLQQFPISHTYIISIPTLTLMDSAGRVLHEFVYNEDFVESAGDGLVEDELVWVRSNTLSGLYFGGAVVLQRDVPGDAAYAAQLQAHGAGGLIVINGRNSNDLQTELVRSTSEPEAKIAIPVFEITEDAFNALLEKVGTNFQKLREFQSPALPLSSRVRQTLARCPLTVTQTANVLGLLPGNDPDLADEVLLVGAYYDHIGQSPDGLYFPGASQNASGVAAMLELARTWQATGYRPARSVLFAAWGAQEKNGAGIAHYLADPTIPLTQTVGVIALDSIVAQGGARLLFHGTKEHDMPLIHRIEAGAAALNRRAWRQGSAGEGWHTAFNRIGIPTSKLIWDNAEEDFYSLTDTADSIDIDRLATSGEILALAASWLAGR